MSVEQKEYKPATPEQIELTEKVLQPTADNIIAEKSKVVARLHNEIAFGYTTIQPKQRVSNDEFLFLEPFEKNLAKYYKNSCIKWKKKLIATIFIFPCK